MSARVFGTAAALLALVLPLRAQAADSASVAASEVAEPSFSWLGQARGISRGWSASRDTPALGWVFMPHEIRTGGAELALLTWRLPSWTLRAGFAGFVELESDGRNGTASKGAILWRGTYAGYAAFALDALGKRICPRCALEFTAQYRHESEHYTASNAGDVGENVLGTPYVGNGIIADAALSERAGDWFFAQRSYALWYVPDQSSYAAGAALDIHARYLRFERLQPFLSLYAEHRVGTALHGRNFPDAHRLRALFGAALPSSLGDIWVYGFGDIGNHYGIRALSEEATLGIGVRLTLGNSMAR